jgi:hypothetical protein
VPHPSKKQLQDSEQEIRDLARGGQGRGDTLGQAWHQLRGDIDREPLLDPED